MCQDSPSHTHRVTSTANSYDVTRFTITSDAVRGSFSRMISSSAHKSSLILNTGIFNLRNRNTGINTGIAKINIILNTLSRKLYAIN
jgi:hypothetical protein